MHLEVLFVGVSVFPQIPLLPGVKVPQRESEPHPEQERELMIYHRKQNPKRHFRLNENYHHLNLYCHYDSHLQEEIDHQLHLHLRRKFQDHRSPTPPPHHSTTRRGHTPAAHGQSSSSPSLLSLACGLQHKLTTRQQRVKAEGEKSQSHDKPQSAHSEKLQQQQNTHNEADGISTNAKLAHRPANQKTKRQENKKLIKKKTQDSTAHAHGCVWDAFNMTYLEKQPGAHSRAAKASEANQNHYFLLLIYIKPQWMRIARIHIFSPQ
ncbi:hypothetical protein TCSYLVIO_009399 [Trypanosoma cruzi]|nr:hypothetical protein TCSYLVIO_009399 [Trypanosoma cruzi]